MGRLPYNTYSSDEGRGKLVIQSIANFKAFFRTSPLATKIQVKY